MLSGLTISLAFTYRTLVNRLLRGFDISYGVYIYHGLVLNCFHRSGHGCGRWDLAVMILPASLGTRGCVVGARGTPHIAEEKWRHAAMSNVEAAVQSRIRNIRLRRCPPHARDAMIWMLIGCMWLFIHRPTRSGRGWRTIASSDSK